jgi:hypothetical protein
MLVMGVGIAAIALLTIAGALPEQQALAVDKGTVINAAQAATLWGGGCESGCEEEADHCADQATAHCGTVNPVYPDPNSPSHWLYQGSGCTSCQQNSNREKCVDLGFCIGWLGTCTDCVPDPAFDCGTKSLGECDLGVCDIVDNQYGQCGTNFQCHTADQ